MKAIKDRIEIVRFQPDDRRAVRDLILPIQQVEFGIAVSEDDQPDLQNIPGFYQVDSGGFWVAKREGQVVGTIGLKHFRGLDAALRKMFVHASFRGSDRGVSRRLFERLLGHARRNGLTGIYLGTTAKFHAAHRFYEKNGFERLCAEALPDGFPRMAVDTVFFVKRLNGKG